MSSSALPMSRSQADKLGERLVAQDRVPPEDIDRVEDVLVAYQMLLDEVVVRLRSLGLDPTSRVKTTGTTIEKLARDPATKLTRIHDLAGCRVVVDGTRNAQDRVVASIVDEFSGSERAPRRIDRRVDPRSGYRAVHVVVFSRGLPVEIQVRTVPQDTWAQAFESFADVFGRQVRYGGDPDVPEQIVTPDGLTTKGALKSLLHVSDIVSRFETSAAASEDLREFALGRSDDASLTEFRSLLEKMRDMENDIESDLALRAALSTQYAKMRSSVKLALNHFDTPADRRHVSRRIRRIAPLRVHPSINDIDDMTAKFQVWLDGYTAEKERAGADADREMRDILITLNRTMSRVRGARRGSRVE